MNEMHSYEITINGGKTTRTPYTYKYGWTKGIQLHIFSQKAVIAFQHKEKHSVEDLTTFKFKLFRDAFRKVYLIHAIKYDCGLKVNNIKITIDGASWEFDANTTNFPFLHSMIAKKKQDLNSSWTNIIPAILDTPKTTKDKDLRFCAVFSYLCAKNRNYRIDCFTNLWTAMNAYGNYIAKRYENTFSDFYITEGKNSNDLAPVLLYGKDIKIIDVLSLMLKKPLDLRNAEAENNLWKGYYEIYDKLSLVTLNDYSELYEESLKALDDSYELPEKYSELQKCATRFGRPLFIFLLIELPYHLRCCYLHGSLSTTLFSAYNDFELDAFGVINYFLDRYLNDIIPKTFDTEFWTEEKYQHVKECVRIAAGKRKKKNRFDECIKDLKLK